MFAADQWAERDRLTRRRSIVVNRVAALVALGGTVAGCFVPAHVELPSAPTRASLEERREAYLRYRPLAQRRYAMTPPDNRSARHRYSFFNALVLANGVSVTHPNTVSPVKAAANAT
jgi:hypothetical protein